MMQPMSVRERTSDPTERRARALVVLTWLNAALLVLFVMLNIEPMRSWFGRTTGLWSSCVRDVGHNTTTEVWSPWILVMVAVPAAAALVLGELTDAPPRVLRASRLAAAALLILAGVGVLVSTGTCMT